MRSDAFPHLPTFADRLEWARVYRGFKSVRALAKAVNLTERQLYRLTNEGHTTKMATMEQLATALQVDPGWLAYGNGVPFLLPAVQAFLATEKGKELEPEAVRLLEKWPLEFFGSLNPGEDEIREAVFLIEILLGRARKRGDGDQDKR